MTKNNIKREFCFEFYISKDENSYQVFSNTNIKDNSTTYDVELRFRSDHDGFWETDEGNSEYEIDAKSPGTALLYFLAEYCSWSDYEKFKKEGLALNRITKGDIIENLMRIEEDKRKYIKLER